MPRWFLVVLQHVPPDQVPLGNGQPVLLLLGVERRPDLATVVGEVQSERPVLVNAEGLVEARLGHKRRGRRRRLEMLQNDLGQRVHVLVVGRRRVAAATALVTFGRCEWSPLLARDHLLLA